MPRRPAETTVDRLRRRERDDRGYVKTGADIGRAIDGDRFPFRLETSMPGVFAVGDIRSGSLKRVAAAVGEGSSAIRHVHDYLALVREKSAWLILASRSLTMVSSR